MAVQITVKRGAALRVQAIIANPDGSAMTDLMAEWISAEIRDGADALVGELSWTVGAPGLALGIADTSEWRVGSHRCDIRVARPDGVVFSETFPVRVDAAVTQAPVP